MGGWGTDSAPLSQKCIRNKPKIKAHVDGEGVLQDNDEATRYDLPDPANPAGADLGLALTGGS